MYSIESDRFLNAIKIIVIDNLKLKSKSPITFNFGLNICLILFNIFFHIIIMGNGME